MGAAFQMDPPDWRVWHPSPSKPNFVLPDGAVDAHCHVFGPGGVFPYAPERKYTPCDASKNQLWALREHIGISRNVIVQATCHGSDNRALVDALKSSNGSAKGVATVKRDVSDDELAAIRNRICKDHGWEPIGHRFQIYAISPEGRNSIEES